MTRWRVLAAIAVVIALAVVFVPVSQGSVCGFERGGLHFPRSCYTEYRNVLGFAVHPLLTVAVTLSLIVAGLVLLLRRPSPPFINSIMEGRGARFALLRALLFVASGAALIVTFFVVPLFVLEQTTEMAWYEWAWIGLIPAIYVFLIAFGPRDAWGRRWGSSRHPSALLGPDREPPPDSRRY